jgi:hypothetical protein
MRKKGLSTIVTTLILILLAFVAIGIVWVVIQNVLIDGTEDIDLNSITLDLEIEKVVYSPGQVSVTIKRNSGEGEFDGLNVILFDGSESQIVNINESLIPLQTKTFDISYDGLVKELSIAPTSISGTGEIKSGEVKAKIEYGEDNVVKNIPGIIAWFKLDGDAKEEISGNSGTILNSPKFIEDSNRGTVGEFNGTLDENIVFPLDAPEEGTIIAWIKADKLENYLENTYPLGWRNVHMMGPATAGERDGAIIGGDTPYQVYDWLNLEVYDDSWHQIILGWNSLEVYFYKDGMATSPKTRTDSYPITHPSHRSFGIAGGRTQAWGILNGQIDEVMVFDRVLTEKEISTLYDLFK